MHTNIWPSLLWSVGRITFSDLISTTRRLWKYLKINNRDWDCTCPYYQRDGPCDRSFQVFTTNLHCENQSVSRSHLCINICQCVLGFTHYYPLIIGLHCRETIPINQEWYPNFESLRISCYRNIILFFFYSLFNLYFVSNLFISSCNLWFSGGRYVNTLKEKRN